MTFTRNMAVEVDISVDTERTWSALTQESELRGWLGTEVEIDLMPGGPLSVRSGTPYCSGDHRIERVDPAARTLVITWVIEGCQTQVQWSVRATESGCTVELAHAFPEETPFALGDPLGGDFGVFNELWAYVGGLLKTWVELGEAKCMLDPDREPAPRVEHEMTVSRPASEVFAALVEPEKIKAWNAFAPAPAIEPRVGGNYSFGWSSEDSGKDGPDEIVEFEQGHKITYSWHGEPRTLVSWTVEPLPGTEEKTKIRLVHSGFGVDQNMLVGWNLGWAGFLQSLALYLERGTAPDWMREAS